MGSGGIVPSAMLIDKVEIVKLNSETTPSQISDDAVILTLREQSSIFLDSVLAIKIDSALIRIKDEIETIQYIHAFRDYQNKQLLINTSSQWSKNWYEGSLLTGEPFIDSLNTFYNLAKVDTPLFSNIPIYVLIYNQPLKTPLLAEIIEKLPDIIYADPNWTIGDGDNIEFINKDSLWHFTFSIGREDCPAGCMFRYYWYITINPKDLSSKPILEEERPRDFTIPIIYRWNIPSRYSMTMFENISAIFDSIKYSNSWWVRRHAIEGIGLFWESKYPWCGEDNYDHWIDLKNSLTSSKDEVVNILNESVNDRDKEVKTSAEMVLNKIITTNVNEKEYNPVNIILSQNYPNPFNPTTKIKYTIPTPPVSSPLTKGRIKEGFITLKVYDILGNEVATLVNKEQSPGSYEVEFDATKYKLSSGIYFYILKVGENIIVRKMCLIK